MSGNPENLQTGGEAFNLPGLRHAKTLIMRSLPKLSRGLLNQDRKLFRMVIGLSKFNEPQKMWV